MHAIVSRDRKRAIVLAAVKGEALKRRTDDRRARWRREPWSGRMSVS
jgi:hypothetical protein